MTADANESKYATGRAITAPIDTQFAWLQTPPDGPAPKPPVDTRKQALPLSELSWQDFERLILRLVRREGPVVECAVYGTLGQAQGGIDILATDAEQGSEPLCYQCKKVIAFGPADVVVAVDKFLEGRWAQSARSFVLCVSMSLESTAIQDAIQVQRVRLAESGKHFSVWDGASAGALQERLKAHPDLVDDFFGRVWAESFLGTNAASLLGERLNGYELGTLRKRLLTLYTVLFQQHDPGIVVGRVRQFDYRNRYVIADVVERTYVDVSDDRSPHKSESDVERAPLETVIAATTRSTSYEVRHPVFEWLRGRRQCLLLGEAGYGKSATLRFLALSILQPERLPLGTFDTHFLSCLPVWLSFARFSASIEKNPSISLTDFFQDWLHQYSFDDVYPLFQRASRAGQILLLVDGLDEAATEQAGHEAVERILTFVPSADASIICTSRPQSFRNLRVPPTWATASLTALSDKKIEELAARWFTILEPPIDTGVDADVEAAAWARDRAQAFVRVVRDSPRTLELARNPLLCQSLIQIFRFSHQLPEARIAVYQQIVDLLISKHPAARAQAGACGTTIGSLELRTADVNEVLIRLAWAMQSSPGGAMSRQSCEQVCTTFLMDDTYGLGDPLARARRLASDLIDQLITNYGVLVERSPGEFGLLHLSLQEYLSAESITRLSQQEQLDWLAKIWSITPWRESLLNWFGILGARGNKPLAALAARKLEEFGEVGEWQRLQSLELRTQIATSDLGLPISEARRIVEQAILEAEVSPFKGLRISLARHLTLGALDRPVRNECQQALRRWLPGRGESVRHRLLAAFRTWQPSDALRVTLLRGLQDSHILCRRAAIESFLTVFTSDANTSDCVRDLAIHHLQPEVRAAALHGLSSRPECKELARTCAAANEGATHPELLMAILQIKISNGEQNEKGLEQLWELWQTDVVDFYIKDELLELLCQGWPQHPRLRKGVMSLFSSHLSPMDIELPMLYLIRCYPGDEGVAELVARTIENGGSLWVYEENVWDLLRSNGFQGHPRIATVLRAYLKEKQDKYPSIHWDPRTAAAMALLGDDAARDALIASYSSADLRGRYWIASGMHRGWMDDERVLAALTQWASDDIDLAAPLADFADVIFPDRAKRHVWLKALARETSATREIGAIVMLLEQWPDEDTRQIADSLLEDSRVWYYHRMTLQGLYARAFPTSLKSLEILHRSLDEIDGPNPGSFAGVFEQPTEVASRLLTAAVPAATDVRLVVTSVLRERAAELEAVVEGVSRPLAEADSAVRASGLMAWARAARQRSDTRSELAQMLLIELNAIGSYMDIRRRCALAGLLEMGAYELIASTFASQNRGDWKFGLLDLLHRDAISISAVVEHWSRLKPYLQQQGLNTEFPVSEVVRLGYEGLVDQDPVLQIELDEYFRTDKPDLIEANYFETFARRHPRSQRLRSIALRTVRQRGEVACAAARTLGVHFSEQQVDIWPELSPMLGRLESTVPHLAEGVLGHLTLWWPSGAIATWVGAMPASELSQLGARDQLLIALAFKNDVKAEAAAAALLTRPCHRWSNNIEDSHALRLWARSPLADAYLVRWLSSNQPSQSITALALMARERRDLISHVDSIIERFNAQCLPATSAPLQGFNAITSNHEAWAAAVYETMRAQHQMTA